MGSASSEEARRFLGRRLALFHGVGFVIAASFLVAVVGSRSVLGDPLVELRDPSRYAHLAATVLMGTLHLVTRRGVRSERGLVLLDAAGILGITALLNLNAGLFAVRTVAVFNMALTTGVGATLRAVIVPSTARRTLLLGVTASAFTLAVFFASALWPGWPVRQHSIDWPLSFQTVSLVLWLSVLIATATVASRVIYGLREEVRSARKLGQYVLEEKLGEGGMGVVYRATHAMLKRATAVKLLPPDQFGRATIKRFEREVTQTARLRHPNTIAIYDYGRTPEGIFYYAMELLDGLNLEELVKRAGPLPPGRAVHLLTQACSSLEEAHDLGIIHRDVKPANLFVVARAGLWDWLKVLDFGLVKDLSVADEGVSRAEHVLGTPQYMAPEVIASATGASPSSDLYGLAATAYFLLTGTHVFEGETIIAVCAAHLNEEPEPPSKRLGRELPAKLEAVVLRGLAKKPEARFGSASALREALLACDVEPWTEEDARQWWLERGPPRRGSSAPPPG
ncbi:MAG: serine/threonine-protein kinase [Polyangiaceae bacterium]